MAESKPLRYNLIAAAPAAFSFDERIAVHAFLDAGVCFVCADIDHIERAEMLAAKVMAALVNGAMDIGVFLLIHHETLLT